jgi:hypothetical protein
MSSKHNFENILFKQTKFNFDESSKSFISQKYFLLIFSFNLTPEQGTFALSKFDLSGTTLMTSSSEEGSCNPGGNNRKLLVNKYTLSSSQ